MTSKLSIILTLYGRDEYNSRWLDFIREGYQGSQVIIADGNEFPDTVDRLIENYPDLDIQHIWLKKDTGVSDFLKKINNALSHAKGEYIIFADNDDLIIENVVLKNIKAMAAQDLSIAICKSYRFKYVKSKLNLLLLNQMPYNNSDKGMKRIEKSIVNFPSDYIYYGIYEKTYLQKVMNNMTKFDLVYWINMEFAITTIGSHQIAQKHLMEPFLFRDAGTYGNAKSLVDKEAFANIVFDEKFPRGFNSLCDFMKSELELGDQDTEKLKNILKQEIVKRIARRYLKQIKRMPTFIVNTLIMIDLVLRGKRKTNVKSDDHAINRVEQFLSRSTNLDN